VTGDALRFSDEYRSPHRARVLADRLAATARPDRAYRIMEVCGGHTHAIGRHGLPDLVPDNVTYVHGPGCPVCVLPRARLDDVVTLVRDHPEVTLLAYGDVLRVPGTHGSLLEARSAGADVRIAYSPLDAVAVAEAEPHRQVVFLGIGFETTAPATAAAVVRAAEAGLANFSVHVDLVRVVPPLVALLDDPTTSLDALIGPGHVSTIIGCRPYVELAERFGLPIVVSGFEPLDLLAATLAAVGLIEAGRAEVVNGYRRAVTWDGNAAAQALLADVFEVRDTFEWRGLGWIPASGYRLAERYRAFDAEARWELPGTPAPDPRACRCGDVLRGALRPDECRVFGTACTPEHPIGACMVSSEGACAAAYRYGGLR
jgi:hydrogenase expression/formation protein HypD